MGIDLEVSYYTPDPQTTVSTSLVCVVVHPQIVSRLPTALANNQ